MPEWVGAVSRAGLKRLLPTMRTGSAHRVSPVPPGQRWSGSVTELQGGGCREAASCLSLGSKSVARGPPSSGGAENGGKGPRWGPQTDTAGTERSGWDRRVR